jgi:hypothetical protein
MLLSVLLLAAAVQAAPSPPDPAAAGRATPEAVEAIATQKVCLAQGVDLAINIAPTTRAKVKALGDLPPANHTLTVLRSVDGCPVSSTVRYNVDRPARR